MIRKIRRVINYCREIDKTIVILCGIHSLLTAMAPYLVTLMISEIINLLQEGSGTTAFYASLIRYFVILTIVKLLQILITYRYNLSVNQAGMLTGIQFGKQLLHAGFSKLEDSEVRDEQARLRAQIGAGNIVAEVLSPLFTSLFAVTMFGYSLSKISPLLVLLLVGIVVLRKDNLHKLERNKQKIKAYNGYAMRRQDYLFKVATDYKWAKEIKVNHLTELLQSKYKAFITETKTDLKKTNRKNSGNRLVECLFEGGTLVLNFVYPIFLFSQKAISLSQFSLIITSGSQFSNAFGLLLEKYTELLVIADALEDMVRFEEKLSDGQAPAVFTERMPADWENVRIEFKNVYFKYPHSEQSVLENISFVIEPNEKVALVGLNGAGKSTIIKLLCGFYQPTFGEILVNGVSLKQWNQSDWRQKMSVLLQDFQLFALPVRENICLTRPFDKNEVERAMALSGISQKISHLPQGIDSQVTRILTDEGFEFSGGESQKIAAARAF